MIRNKIVWGAIAAIILLLVIILVLPNSKTEENGDNGANELAPASSNTLGSGEAVLIEAYSFGCPVCESHHSKTLQHIREEYKDQITFQVVHFPLTTSFRNARAGHRAAEAAAKQGKFWEMHDILFEQREFWTQEATTQPVPQIEIFAEEIGLDLEQFKLDFESSEINDIINQDEDYLKSLGVDGTPAYFLNGSNISNSHFQELESARSILDKALGLDDEAADDQATGEDGQQVEENLDTETDGTPDTSGSN